MAFESASNPPTAEPAESKPPEAPAGPSEPEQKPEPAQVPVASIPQVFIPRYGGGKSSLPAPETSAAEADEPVAGLRLPAIQLTVTRLAILAATLFLGFLFTFWFGRSSVGNTPAKPVSTLAPTPLSAAAMKAFEAALAQLRGGKSIEALNAMKALLAAHPTAPSLHYAAAISAMQAGYLVEAEKLANESLRLGLRVSDSLALKAAISAMTSGKPSATQESLLREAIATDPMNSSPFLELATLMRYQGKNDEARHLLESASLRMNPADSRAVLDTTLALLSARPAPADGFTPTGTPSRDFPAALSELKNGNYQNAANILRACRENLSPDLYSYLVNDPELRKFARQPELAGLY
ncbi:MAG: tetratricopeptide repeat protein [Terrimicrobiaceae bacterium]